MVTTNAMRCSPSRHPLYPPSYAYDESDLSGVHAAQALGLDPDEVFKTLVLRGNAPACSYAASRWPPPWT